MRAITLFITFACLAGCAHSTIVPSKISAKASTPVAPELVGIYRTQGPLTSFSELGVITFRASIFDLNAIFDQLRKDAGAVGAESVVDLKITSETHTETESIQRCTPHVDCDSNGMCSSHDICVNDWVTKDVSTYLAAGTLIKRGTK